MVFHNSYRSGHKGNRLTFFSPTFFLIVLVHFHVHIPHSSQSSLPTDTVAFIQGQGRQTLTEEGRPCVFHTGISTWKLSLISFKTVPQFSPCADFCLPRLLSHPPYPHSWLRVINTWFWNVILEICSFIGYFCGISTWLHARHSLHAIVRFCLRNGPRETVHAVKSIYRRTKGGQE